MEQQWEQATRLLNENTMQKQIEQLNIRMSDNNMELIRLKKENQLLKLQNNMLNPAAQKEDTE